MEAVDRADPQKVFSETICLLSTATARAAASAFATNDEARQHLVETLQALPLTLHSYVAGGEVLRSRTESPEGVEDLSGHLEHMLDFYNAHLAQNKYPDQKSLRNVMILWMGRISPPGMEEHPEARVERLELVDRLTIHLRLVEAYARNAAAS